MNSHGTRPAEHSASGSREPAAGRRRGTVACRRCRRLRGKCVHESTQPPCEGCRHAGEHVAAECYFPTRGEKSGDRDFRAKRIRRGDGEADATPPSFAPFQDVFAEREQSTLASPSATVSRPTTTFSASDDQLPPKGELIEGCRMFTTSYFQLGFIPKALFLERLSRDDHSVSRFLLASILAISARFTPALVVRYGDGTKATSHFLHMASSFVLDEMYDPALERIQAFFLLSIAQWGNGDKHRSIIHMGIAVRMAAMLGLHREETYTLPADATREETVESEIARRTFWMLQSQDNLHAGHGTPASFFLGDITTLLPSHESEFAFGKVPQYRAALPDTPAAMSDPGRVAPANRSLFATLIQAHNLWGIVARNACRTGESDTGALRFPAEADSQYRQLSDKLKRWEDALPVEHTWSVWNLRGYKAENLDLAYLAIVMVIRLSNIVLRRTYLEDIISASHSNFDSSVVAHSKFWETMSHELFANVLELHQQISAFFPLRLKEDGFPAVLAFCVYVCGTTAAYLWRWPNLSHHLASRAEDIAKQSLAILNDLQHAWPAASRWQRGLKQATTPAHDHSFSPATARNPLGIPPDHVESHAGNPPQHPIVTANYSDPSGQTSTADVVQPPHVMNALNAEVNALGAPENDLEPDNTSIEAFEAELAALLQDDLSAGFYGGWELPHF